MKAEDIEPYINLKNDRSPRDPHKYTPNIQSTKGNRMSAQEARAWQAGQLELVNQLIELQPTHDLGGLLYDWQQILANSEPV